MALTPRGRVEKVLREGKADKVPFTIYENKIPQCTVERQLRNRGLCIVQRTVPVLKVTQPHVRMTQHTYTDQGRTYTRTQYETPVGTLSSLAELAGFTSWTHEHLFKTQDDYKALKFLIDDTVLEPNYAGFLRVEEDAGTDIIMRGGIGLEPLQTLISGYMGTETYCFEWMDRRDEVLKLYDAIVDVRRRTYPMLAESPAWTFNYGGNVTPEIVGLQVFEDYYLPHYQEACEVLHQAGKLVGVHFDANCRLFSKAIARSSLDYIEAFTPEPDTDMTLAEARQAWPGKVLWINFPSSVHLRSNHSVEQMTFDLVDSLGHVDGLIFGITEDIPPERWQESCTAIMDGLDRHAATRPEWYHR